MKIPVSSVSRRYARRRLLPTDLIFNPVDFPNVIELNGSNRDSETSHFAGLVLQLSIQMLLSRCKLLGETSF